MEMKETENFFQILHTLWPDLKIDLFFISEKRLHGEGRGRLCLARDVPVDMAFQTLKKENAWWKNQKRGENVYFAPSSKMQTFPLLFVDDPREEKTQDFACILVETSKMKYQAYFRLDEPAPIEEARAMQKLLIQLFEGDLAAGSIFQLRRVPGFSNTKYSEKPIVRTVKCQNVALSTQELRALIQKIQPQPKTQTLPPPTATTQKSKASKPKQKSWEDFFSGDRSQADFRYALYLMGLGWNEKEIFETLLKESPSLAERKGHRHVESYLIRTIQKAKKVYR